MKNNEKISLLFILTIVIIWVSSCKKERISPTPAELTTIQLQNLIKSNNIQRVLAFEINYPFSYDLKDDVGKNYVFSNGFITISGFSKSFNLSYLDYYNIEDLQFVNSNGMPPTTYHCLTMTFPPE